MAGRKSDPKSKNKKIDALKNKSMDKKEKIMYNENKDTKTDIASDVEEQSVVLQATQPVISTNTPKTISNILTPLKNDEEDQLIKSLLNDVVDLKPSRSNQNLTVFWKGKDIRIKEVQDNCPFHFAWKSKGKEQDYGTVKNAQGARIVSKKAFTLPSGHRLLTVGSDSTPDQDFFTYEGLILTYIQREAWTMDRIKSTIKNNRKASDTIANNTEQYNKSAVRLANNDIDGAIQAVSTKELLDRFENGDLDAVKDSLNDGFPSKIVKL